MHLNFKCKISNVKWNHTPSGFQECKDNYLNFTEESSQISVIWFDGSIQANGE